MIDPKDRPLFEALCVAHATTRRVSDGAVLKASSVIRHAQEDLLAIRAAEGPEATEDPYQYDFVLASAYNWRSALGARQPPPQPFASRARDYSDGFADGARETTRDWAELTHQSEAVIHALCDARARLRHDAREYKRLANHWLDESRRLLEAGYSLAAEAESIDDHAGATDEDELTQHERLALTWLQGCAHPVDAYAVAVGLNFFGTAETLLESLVALGYVEAIDVGGRRTQYRAVEQEVKPAPRVLPVGHAPERLEVGMVLVEHTGSPSTVMSIANGHAYTSYPPSEEMWFWQDRTTKAAAQIHLTLAEPFTVTGES